MILALGYTNGSTSTVQGSFVSLLLQERQGNLQQFKDKGAKFLICTDVAARGLDIRGVPFVINVTLPDEKANYVHRIGRVGRADRYVESI